MGASGGRSRSPSSPNVAPRDLLPDDDEAANSDLVLEPAVSEPHSPFPSASSRLGVGLTLGYEASASRCLQFGLTGTDLECGRLLLLRYSSPSSVIMVGLATDADVVVVAESLFCMKMKPAVHLVELIRHTSVW